MKRKKVRGREEVVSKRRKNALREGSTLCSYFKEKNVPDT
jgi:hypothetical protein